MAHVIFMVLHVVAFFISWWLFFLTLPLHLIYIALSKPKVDSNAPTPETHVRCPDCRELVRMDARKCKHCGCVLVPQTIGSQAEEEATDRALAPVIESLQRAKQESDWASRQVHVMRAQRELDALSPHIQQRAAPRLSQLRTELEALN